MGLILIGGDNSVKRAAALRERMLQEMDNGDELVLDFEGVEHIDLAVAQLVLSAMKSAKELHKVVRVHNASEQLKGQFILTGILKEN